MGMALYLLDAMAYVMIDSPMMGVMWEKYEIPVEIIQQEEELMGGRVERSLPDAPSLISFCRLGSSPASIQGPSRSRVTPSSPMTRTLIPGTLILPAAP